MIDPEKAYAGKDESIKKSKTRPNDNLFAMAEEIDNQEVSYSGEFYTDMGNNFLAYNGGLFVSANQQLQAATYLRDALADIIEFRKEVLAKVARGYGMFRPDTSSGLLELVNYIKGAIADRKVEMDRSKVIQYVERNNDIARAKQEKIMAIVSLCYSAISLAVSLASFAKSGLKIDSINREIKASGLEKGEKNGTLTDAQKKDLESKRAEISKLREAQKPYAQISMGLQLLKPLVDLLTRLIFSLVTKGRYDEIEEEIKNKNAAREANDKLKNQEAISSSKGKGEMGYAVRLQAIENRAASYSMSAAENETLTFVLDIVNEMEAQLFQAIKTMIDSAASSANSIAKENKQKEKVVTGPGSYREGEKQKEVEATNFFDKAKVLFDKNVSMASKGNIILNSLLAKTGIPDIVKAIGDIKTLQSDVKIAQEAILAQASKLSAQGEQVQSIGNRINQGMFEAPQNIDHLIPSQARGNAVAVAQEALAELTQISAELDQIQADANSGKIASLSEATTALQTQMAKFETASTKLSQAVAELDMHLQLAATTPSDVEIKTEISKATKEIKELQNGKSLSQMSLSELQAHYEAVYQKLATASQAVNAQSVSLAKDMVALQAPTVTTDTSETATAQRTEERSTLKVAVDAKMTELGKAMATARTYAKQVEAVNNEFKAKEVAAGKEAKGLTPASKSIPAPTSESVAKPATPVKQEVAKVSAQSSSPVSEPQTTVAPISAEAISKPIMQVMAKVEGIVSKAVSATVTAIKAELVRAGIPQEIAENAYNLAVMANATSSPSEFATSIASEIKVSSPTLFSTDPTKMEKKIELAVQTAVTNGGEAVKAEVVAALTQAPINLTQAVAVRVVEVSTQQASPVLNPQEAVKSISQTLSTIVPAEVSPKKVAADISHELAPLIPQKEQKALESAIARIFEPETPQNSSPIISPQKATQAIAQVVSQIIPKEALPQAMAKVEEVVAQNIASPDKLKEPEKLADKVTKEIISFVPQEKQAEVSSAIARIFEQPAIPVIETQEQPPIKLEVEATTQTERVKEKEPLVMPERIQTPEDIQEKLVEIVINTLKIDEAKDPEKKKEIEVAVASACAKAIPMQNMPIKLAEEKPAGRTTSGTTVIESDPNAEPSSAMVAQKSADVEKVLTQTAVGKGLPIKTGGKPDKSLEDLKPHQLKGLYVELRDKVLKQAQQNLQLALKERFAIRMQMKLHDKNSPEYKALEVKLGETMAVEKEARAEIKGFNKAVIIIAKEYTKQTGGRDIVDDTVAMRSEASGGEKQIARADDVKTYMASNGRSIEQETIVISTLAARSVTGEILGTKAKAQAQAEEKEDKVEEKEEGERVGLVRGSIDRSYKKVEAIGRSAQALRERANLLRNMANEEAMA